MAGPRKAKAAKKTEKHKARKKDKKKSGKNKQDAAIYNAFKVNQE